MYAQNDCILLLNAISKYHIIVLWSLLYYSLFESYLRKWHELNTNIYFIILTGCNISRWNISDVERGFWESRFNWVMYFYNLNCHYNCHWNLLEINFIIFELHLTDTISMLTFWTFTPTRVHFIALTSSILNTILVVRVGSGRYFWSRIISFKVIFCCWYDTFEFIRSHNYALTFNHSQCGTNKVEGKFYFKDAVVLGGIFWM
jgi:hypothetical protein